MITENKKSIVSAVGIMVVLLITAGSTTSKTIGSSNAFSCGDVSEDTYETTEGNHTYFFLFFGLIIADAVITYVEIEHDNITYGFFCEQVNKVTIIGFGSFLHDNDSKADTHFYLNTFTNVSYLAGETYRKLEVSEEYQYFILFVTLHKSCMFVVI